jgi:hypothetical protein
MIDDFPKSLSRKYKKRTPKSNFPGMVLISYFRDGPFSGGTGGPIQASALQRHRV